MKTGNRCALLAILVLGSAFGAGSIAKAAPRTDHPRLLAVIAGACAAAGANIVDAQIFTTSDGRALDTIHVSREFPNDEDELRRAGTIGRMIEDVLSGRKRLPDVIATRAKNRKKSKAFIIPPSVAITNSLSNKFTVIEVECLDRPGLLSEMTAGDRTGPFMVGRKFHLFHELHLQWVGEKVTGAVDPLHPQPRLKIHVSIETCQRSGKHPFAHLCINLQDKVIAVFEIGVNGGGGDAGRPRQFMEA